VRFVFSKNVPPAKAKMHFAGWNFLGAKTLVRLCWRMVMLVERGLRVMNVGVVGEAYAIAANYLCRSGAIADDFVTNERLLAIIIQMFERGEFNKIKLANKAIAQFEAEELV
jgi:hypothetical protein